MQKLVRSAKLFLYREPIRYIGVYSHILLTFFIRNSIRKLFFIQFGMFLEICRFFLTSYFIHRKTVHFVIENNKKEKRLEATQSIGNLLHKLSYQMDKTEDVNVFDIFDSV